MLAVETRAQFDESITEYEYRTHTPFTSTSFKPNDEVRIAINQQDGFTYPCESYLHVTGNVTKADGRTNDPTLEMCNNAIAFLINEIRYEIGGVIVDRTKSVGVTTCIRNFVSLTPSDEIRMMNACWLSVGKKVKVQEFSFCIPLKMLMGFFEDYNRIIVNQKQELILLMSSTTKDSLFKDGADAAFRDFKLTVSRISWRVPYVKCSDTVKLSLLKLLNQDRVLEMPFRSWELHEFPELPSANRQSWTVKTSSQLEKPRYVVLALQSKRKNDLSRDASVFDKCSLTEVKLFLNSQYYPYDNLRGDSSLMYEMYARFQSAYYGVNTPHPVMHRRAFDDCPLFVIDCSKQSETLKTGPVDIRLEFEASVPFPAGTTAYCLIIHDALIEYSPLTGFVNRVH